ncbi:hypothetical protein F5B19DRAFT_480826 [Rostrohypoxylon terebratum]|nr:hypothetical protein F5B19DRAFT_480826 [Rostrohypoxylon terebratum]
MPRSTRNHAVSRTASATEFHNFLKLPIELQIMIWNFYWPRTPVRHCFTIDVKEGRKYGALDLQSGRYIDRSERRPKRHVFDMIPALTKIKLPGTVRVHGERRARYRVKNPIIYADFSIDIFYFDYCSYYGTAYENRQDEWFRFLRCPIYQINPLPLRQDHWIFKVEHIAFFVPREGLTHSFWDDMVISSMKSLKTLWLVTFQLDRGKALPFWETYRRFVTDGGKSRELSLQMHSRGKATEHGLRVAIKAYGIKARIIIARNGPADVV